MTAEFCGVQSTPGLPMTVYVEGQAHTVSSKNPRLSFICTQDRGHGGEVHKACDGWGRVLATWPRRESEQRWRR